MLSKLKLQMMAAVSTLIGMITLGTIVYKFLEGWSWIQCFYFSVSTLSTVGYGDLHPTTDGSRLFTALYILSGVAIALSALGIIGMNYIEMREKRLSDKKERKRKKHG
jgi:NhaP-type Na+/H+ or K+/H+ antiporter